MYSRRDFGKLVLASLPMMAAAGPAAVFGGVRFGVQSWSFRDRPLDEAIQAMAQIGLGECELWQGHVEPKLPDDYGASTDKSKREELRKWRSTVSMDVFHAVRKKFERAGVKLYAYDYSFRDDFSEAESVRGLEMARALGVKYITASSTITMARKIEKYAEKAGIVVGMHGHSATHDPNEFSSPESFEKAMASGSPYIGVTLDLGHLVAAGGDPVAFLEKHHQRVVSLHIKDRKKDQGPNMPFGQGDTPIGAVLRLLKTRQYNIPALIEYAYKGGDTVAEIRKCLEYCRQLVA